MQAQVNITDRAKRYRAQNNVTGPRKCVLCGSKSDLGVMHLTGNESHGEAANLAYGCRSCNGKLAAAFKRIGAGKPTNQYNPSKGVPSFEQYAWAVSSGEREYYPGSTRHKPGAHDEAGAIIHATPKHKRIEYAKRIASAASGTRRRAADDRWNPAFAVLRGGKVVFKSEDRYEASQHATDLKRAYPTEKIAFAERQTKANPWPFSRPDARRTTPAHGGIAYHQAKAGKRPAAKSKAKAAPGASRMPDEAALQAGFKRGLTLNEILALNPALRKSRAANPAKFDRCVKAVQKKGGANAYAVCSKLKGKRNPAGASAEVYEDFHGFPPKEVVTVSKEIHHHAHLASLGTLVLLEVYGVDERGHTVKGFKGALLACNESRDQLFIEGGDQSINLKDFKITSPHEMETLGRVTNIGYKTNKTHLGDEGGEAVYVHRFRQTNENGKHVMVKMTREPDLIYDVRNEQLLFSGGSYEILREGINK